MASPIKVSTFTPVETGNTLSKLPAEYLSPLFCNKEVAVITLYVDADGNQICTLKKSETTFTATAFKIATYILSAGILPLLAILLNLAIRCGSNYHYIPVQQQPEIPNPPPPGNENTNPVETYDQLVKRLYESEIDDKTLKEMANNEGTPENKSALLAAIAQRKNPQTQNTQNSNEDTGEALIEGIEIPGPGVQLPRFNEEGVKGLLHSGMGIEDITALYNDADATPLEKANCRQAIIRLQGAAIPNLKAGALPPAGKLPRDISKYFKDALNAGKTSKQITDEALEKFHDDEKRELYILAYSRGYWEMESDGLREEYQKQMNAADDPSKAIGERDSSLKNVDAIKLVLQARNEDVVAQPSQPPANSEKGNPLLTQEQKAEVRLKRLKLVEPKGNNQDQPVNQDSATLARDQTQSQIQKQGLEKKKRPPRIITNENAAVNQNDVPKLQQASGPSLQQPPASTSPSVNEATLLDIAVENGYNLLIGRSQLKEKIDELRDPLKVARKNGEIEAIKTIINKINSIKLVAKSQGVWKIRNKFFTEHDKLNSTERINRQVKLSADLQDAAESYEAAVKAKQQQQANLPVSTGAVKSPLTSGIQSQNANGTATNTNQQQQAINASEQQQSPPTTTTGTGPVNQNEVANLSESQQVTGVFQPPVTDRTKSQDFFETATNQQDQGDSKEKILSSLFDLRTTSGSSEPVANLAIPLNRTLSGFVWRKDKKSVENYENLTPNSVLEPYYMAIKTEQVQPTQLLSTTQLTGNAPENIENNTPKNKANVKNENNDE